VFWVTAGTSTLVSTDEHARVLSQLGSDTAVTGLLALASRRFAWMCLVGPGGMLRAGEECPHGVIHHRSGRETRWSVRPATWGQSWLGYQAWELGSSAGARIQCSSRCRPPFVLNVRAAPPSTLTVGRIGPGSARHLTNLLRRRKFLRHTRIGPGECQMTVQAAAVAAALAELDVRPDDRVLIMLPDGPGFAESITGAIQQGAVPLPVNPLLPARDVVAVAAKAGARLGVGLG
jgi:hypothetical protein